MSIRTTYKDSEFGRRLIDMDRRVQRDLDDLESLRSDLPHLKTQIDADPDYTAQQKTDAKAEVDAVISSAVQRIKDFAASI